MRSVLRMLLLTTLLLAGCSQEPTQGTATATTTLPATPVPTPVESTQCPLIVRQALTAVDAACRVTGRNQVCYGNVQLSAEFRDAEASVSFEHPGDIANLNDVRKIALSPLNPVTNQWGVALMQVQANLPDSLPGQNVTFLLFGDVEFENVSDGDSQSQGFYFRTGIGDSSCSEAPESGILVQTPTGVSEVALRMNGVDIALGSTAYLQAQPDSNLVVNVLEGKAAVSSQGETTVVAAGNRTQIPMSADLNPAGPPSAPEPYEESALQSLPVNNLDRHISLAAVLISSDFQSDDEGWTAADSSTPIEYQVADETSNGAICSAAAYFVAPAAWLGDQSGAFGGAFSFIAPAAPNASIQLLLEGSGISLTGAISGRPAGDWLVYSLDFNENKGWLNSQTGAPATISDLQSALTDVTALHIRESESSSESEFCLDYVQMSAGIESTTIYERPADFIPTVVAALGTQQNFEIAIGDSISGGLEPGMGGIDLPGETDVYRFAAEQGQKVYFSARGVSNTIGWSLSAPDGTLLFEDSQLWENNDPGIIRLDRAGVYTITVSGRDNATGAYAFAVTAVGDDQSFAISPDVRVFEDVPAPGAGRIDSAGERDIYTLGIQETADVFFSAMGEQNGASWTLTAPDGTNVFEDQRLWQGNHPGAFTLETGSYTLTVGGVGDTTGTYAFAIWITPPPQAFNIELGTVVSDGAPQPGMGRIESPGAQDIYSLLLTEAADVTFSALGEETRALWSLIAPDGTVLFENQRLWQGNHPGTLRLDAGVYAIIVKGDLGESGAYRFSVTQLEDAAPIRSDEVKLLEVSSAIETAGQQQRYTFEAEPGQQVFIEIHDSKLTSRWVIVDAGESVVSDTYRSGLSSVGPLALERGGPVTLTVSGYSDETGTYDFTLWNVPAPDQFDIAMGSVISAETIGSGAGTIETPGTMDIYTFVADPGQQVFIEVLDAEFTAYFQLTDETGDQLFNSYRGGGSNIGLLSLEHGGSYTFAVSGYAAETGAYRFRIWDVPSPDSFEIQVGDTVAAEITGPGAGAIESPGAADFYTFTAQPGQKIFIHIPASELTLLCVLTDSEGNAVVNSYRSGESSLGEVTLETGGTYSMSISGYDMETGTYRIQTWLVPEPDAFEIQIGDSIAAKVTGQGAGTIESPGVMDIYTFTAQPGQKMFIHIPASELTLLCILTDAEGNIVVNSYRTGESSLGVVTLESGGAYTLRISGYGMETGTYRLQTWLVPEPDHFDIAVGDTIAEETTGVGAGNIESPGTVDSYSFSALAGQAITIELIESNLTLLCTLTDSDGNVVFSSYRSGASAVWSGTLSAEGAYTLTIVGYDLETGPYRFVLQATDQTR